MVAALGFVEMLSVLCGVLYYNYIIVLNRKCVASLVIISLIVDNIFLNEDEKHVLNVQCST